MCVAVSVSANPTKIHQWSRKMSTRTAGRWIRVIAWEIIAANNRQ